jgi:uncharacterized protein (TIGR00299 family) protein
MIAHFDPVEGASGDLVLAALIDAGASLDSIRTDLATLPLPSLHLEAPEVRVRALRVRRLEVTLPDEHRHRRLDDVLGILAAGELPPRALERAERVFRRLAEAEARCHGVAVEEIHFHEVGALDSIVDIAGTVLALEHLGVDEITYSPLHVGTGRIDTAHGPLPVPVPAVVELTKGVPIVRTDIPTEILTPTGAALLTTLGRPIASAPFVAESVGIAAGHREFEGGPSLLRVSIGKAVGPEGTPTDAWQSDVVEVLETNLDDMNPEILPTVLERALEAGALDAFLTPIVMKKGRPGHLLTVLAEPARAAELAAVLFRETSTFGVRRRTQTRWILVRESRELETPWGPVRVKIGHLGGGDRRVTPEHDSLRELARTRGVPLMELYDHVSNHIRTIEWKDISPERGSRDS